MVSYSEARNVGISNKAILFFGGVVGRMGIIFIIHKFESGLSLPYYERRQLYRNILDINLNRDG